MNYRAEILEEIKKNNLKIDEDLVMSAYEFANESHVGQYRKSGDDYILHPVEVVKILMNMKMDTETLAAGFLHDIVEDTWTTLADIEYNFGANVARLVDGVTKLTNLPVGTKIQHENIRKMMVAMAQDIRVVIIKLADRLHNMRTLKFMPPEKQQRIARETLEIFAPLAHRLGMAKIKWELEDLSLYYLEPKIYRHIISLINSKRAVREAFTEKVTGALSEILKINGINGNVSGRPKHFYSIYKKMYEKGKSFEEIYDLTAIRVIVETEAECYNVLGLLHSRWKPVPGRFKDYIAVPKSNGYQSIHTTLVGPNGNFVEVQIRTSLMHEICEEGIAAHWSYKEKSKVTKNDQVYSWLKKILEWQKEADDSEEFIKTVTGDILNETVFVFSPKGDVVELRAGSTPLDFAFHIHTQVGLKCIGGKVNDRIVPLDYKLKNGDRVEIITSKASKGPGNDWLNIVVTHSAKSKIRRWIKEQKFDTYLKYGKEIVEKELKSTSLTSKDFEENEIVKDFIYRHNIPNYDEFLFRLAEGKITLDRILKRIISETEKKEEVKLEDIQGELSKKKKKKKASKTGILIDGLDNTIIKFAKCCTPLPGDKVGGYITADAAITVHRKDCSNYKSITERDPAREISAEWDEDLLEKKSNKYDFVFSVIVADRANIIMEILKVISDHKIALSGVNSYPIKIGGEKLSNVKLTIEIREKEEYKKLINNISRIKDVVEVRRG